MTNLYNPNSTICAIATPAGGAIGIVRVSGPEALTCVSPLFQPMGSKTLAQSRRYADLWTHYRPHVARNG